MKLDRLLAITLELMAKKRVRASELAARFEVSTRTIYRDIERINLAGIPVASFTGADGGFELMDGFFLTKQHFTIQDFSVIYQILQGMEESVGGTLTTLKHKLGSLEPKLSQDSYAGDILIDMSTPPGEKEMVRTVYRSIEQNKVISFSYRSASGTVTNRTVEPIRLYWEKGVWYLEGYCQSRNAHRLFRTSRMSRLILTDESFQAKERQPDQQQELPVGIHAQLRFELTAEPRVTEQFQGECRHLGSHIEVETVFYSWDYALSVILSYGPKVVVVSPPELKDALLQTINDIRERYVERVT
jgi:predicted DNA-binding transcriptional regulator YafY